MNDAVPAFLQYMMVERRMSAHTLDAYRRDLDALAAWAEGQGAVIDTLDSAQLRQFIAAEHRRCGLYHFRHIFLQLWNVVIGFAIHGHAMAHACSLNRCCGGLARKKTPTP